MWWVVRKTLGGGGRRLGALNRLSSVCPERDRAELRAAWKAEWTGHGDRWDVEAHREWRELRDGSAVSSLGNWVGDDARN